jgi:hypothetical protein
VYCQVFVDGHLVYHAGSRCRLGQTALETGQGNSVPGFRCLDCHTTIVFMRYMFLAYQCRMETDHRTFSDLFYTCCEEIADISFMQALYRILTLAIDQLTQLGTFCEKTAAAFFDAIMNTALHCVSLSKNNFAFD